MVSAENQSSPYAPPQAVPDEDKETRDLSGSQNALNRVATGLHLVYWGVAIFMLCLIGQLLLTVMSQALSNGVASGLLGVGLGVAFFVSSLFCLVGRVFCLAVPAASGARKVIYVAVAFDVFGLLTNVIERFVGLSGWLSIASTLCSVMAILLFIIFMRRVATFIHQPELAAQAGPLIIMGSTLIVLMVALFISLILTFGYALAAVAVVVIGLTVFVLTILTLLRYVRLLADLRKAILNRQ